MQKGTLFVVAAPSGAGKTSLVGAVIEHDPQVNVSISHTTRPPRPGEQHGVNYHFVNDEKFDELKAAGQFLEYASVFGHQYGTSKVYVQEALERGTDVILEIDWQGAQQIAAQIECVSIFILPPSKKALKDRLVSRRQDTAEVIERRMSEAAKEASHVGEFDYIVVNKDFQRARSDILAIIRSKRLKKAVQLDRHAELIKDLTS